MTMNPAPEGRPKRSGLTEFRRASPTGPLRMIWVTQDGQIQAQWVPASASELPASAPPASGTLGTSGSAA